MSKANEVIDGWRIGGFLFLIAIYLLTLVIMNTTQGIRDTLDELCVVMECVEDDGVSREQVLP